MITLRTVANVWQVERRNRNAEPIALRAARMYDKFVGFVQDMSTLDNRLDQARTAFDDAMGRLSTGQGNLVTQIERLRALGAKTTKSLPAALIADDQPDALESEQPVQLQELTTMVDPTES